MGQSKKKLRRIKALTGSASWPSIVGAAFFWIWMDRAMFGDTLLPDAASSAEHEALAWLAPARHSCLKLRCPSPHRRCPGSRERR